MDFYILQLNRLKDCGLYRERVEFTPIDATHVSIAGKKYLLLASNNYLGLTHYETVKKAAIDAVLTYGTGSGGARLTTGSFPTFNLLEQELAAFKECEDALVFNAGYMANVGIISALVDKDDVVFSDELNHASIIDGCRLAKGQTIVYRHSDMPHLEECLQNTPCQGKRLIVTDGVFSMDGDIAPLDKIVSLAEKYGALVMVDDAHALGVLGHGRGTAAHFKLEGKVHIQMGTLSKTLASEGGYVAGSRDLIAYLVNKARSFIFSTALAPATVAAAYQALQELRSDSTLVTRLLDNAQFMRSTLLADSIPVIGELTPILPIMIGDAHKAMEIAKMLKAEGLILSAIRPPTVPQGCSRLRLTVSAAHSKEDLRAAAEKIAFVYKKIMG